MRMRKKVKIKNRQLRAREGIALTEIIVILTLIITLALLAVPQFQTMQQKVIRDGRLTTLRTLAQATKMYKLEKRGYPTYLTQLYSYTSLTAQMRMFENDIGMYQPTLNATCIVGRIPGLSPLYYVAYCVRTDENNVMTQLANQPACCSGNNCKPDGSGSWFACETRFR